MPVRVPVNCSSITFTVSGVRGVVARVVSGITPQEETALVYNSRVVNRLIYTNPSTGAADIALAPVITSITIASNVYPVTSGRISAVPAAAATAFLGATFNQPFELITGA